MGNPYITLLKTAWLYSRNEKKQFVLVYFLFMIANVVLAMHPLLYGWFINKLQTKGINGLYIATLFVAGYLCLKLAEWAFHGPARVMERKLAFYISKNFLEDQYHKILHMPIRWHQDHHSGATISRVRKGYEALRDFFQNGFIYLYAFGKFFFSFCAMLYFSPVFGAVAVGLGIVTAWIIITFDKPYIKSLKEMNEQEHKVSSALFDCLSNIVTVITLRLEKRMEGSVLNKVMDVFPPFKKNVVINEWKWFAAQMLVALIYTVIILGYVYQNWHQDETFMIGGLVTLIGFVNQFTGVFNDIASQYTKILQYNTEINATILLTRESETLKTVVLENKLSSDWKNIKIKNLNFTRNSNSGNREYGNLHDLHLNLVKGKRIALIGESGSGKSTLLALLRGLYAADAGSKTLVDDKTQVDFSAIGSNVTLFPQEPEIFENTILYNITLGLPFSREEVLEVCKLAHFTDVVKKLPHGLHTHIQEKGVNLSGGQKQRLALARGILAAKHSSIILMDEPTSSVDPRTEKLVYLKFFQEFSEKTVISSLHRLHLLPFFDYIYIMENGRIVEQGDFKELKLKSIIFNELWQHQQEEESEVEKDKVLLRY